jgi:hypothetical protein
MLKGEVEMEVAKKRFKKMFPHLAKEMAVKEHGVAITSVRSDVQTAEKTSSEKFAGYMPDVIDFIRRCDDEQQAKEIINYMEKRGEINREYAQKLRKQLNEKDVRSFGSKKENDYYLKHSDAKK